MKKRDRKKWRGWYVCDEKGGIEEEKERRGTGGFAWMPREKGKKKEKRRTKGKRKKGERERERGTLIPLWMVGRRLCYLLLTNPVVTCGKVGFSFI